MGYSPWPLLIATGEAIPLRGLEGVPGLPGAPQDEAGLTRKFEPEPGPQGQGASGPVSLGPRQAWEVATWGKWLSQPQPHTQRDSQSWVDKRRGREEGSEWVSQASRGVWRDDSGLPSRPCS